MITQKELYSWLFVAMRYLPDSAYLKDLFGRFLWVNEAKAKKHNTTPEGMIGKTDFDFLPYAEAQQIWESENIIYETRIPIQDEIEELPNPDGSKRWNSVTKKLLWDENGNIVGIFGVSRDITERILRQQELALAKKTALEMVRMASHDIQGPITFSAGMLKRVIGGRYAVIDESPRNVLEEISFELERVEKITKDYLRNSSFFIDGAGIKEEELLDMRMQVIEPVLDGFQNEFARRGITIDNRLKSVPIGMIHAPVEDRVDIQIIFKNLFENACKKFSPEDRCKISFGVEFHDHNGKKYPVFNVWDSGEGVPEEKRAKLFEPYRSETSSGVGLHTCREIARKYGGDLWYEHTDAGHPNFKFRYWRPVAK
jgi:PAS domain S-box-containing protein